MSSWKEADLVEGLLAGAVLAVLIWAARERSRVRRMAAPDQLTYTRAVMLVSRVWRSARRRVAARASSIYLFPSLAAWV